jgi:hypothetical protein
VVKSLANHNFKKRERLQVGNVFIKVSNVAQKVDDVLPEGLSHHHVGYCR